MPSMLRILKANDLRSAKSLNRPRGKGVVELTQAADEVASEVEQHDGVLVGRFLVKMMERRGPDLDHPHRLAGAD